MQTKELNIEMLKLSPKEFNDLVLSEGPKEIFKPILLTKYSEDTDFYIIKIDDNIEAIRACKKEGYDHQSVYSDNILEDSILFQKIRNLFHTASRFKGFDYSEEELKKQIEELQEEIDYCENLSPTNSFQQTENNADMRMFKEEQDWYNFLLNSKYSSKKHVK